MGLLKLRKNKKFGYFPRSFENDGNGKLYEIKQKFDDHRITLGENNGLKNKFTNAINELRGPQSRSSNKTILLIVVILILIFLFIIDFDLSIFSLKK